MVQIEGEGAILVLFGAEGDLATRKLVPALYRLHHEGQLPERFLLLGVGRRPHGDAELVEEYRAALAEAGPMEPERWADFAVRVRYLRSDLHDPEAFPALNRRLTELTAGWGSFSVIFYLAVPPELFVPVTEGLGGAGLHLGTGPRRIVLEKPLGRDLITFKQIDAVVSSYFQEHQIFRIDHFLGKETVQNLLVLRFANSIFEPIWNRRYVDHVSITVAEEEGIGTRGGYYEGMGALRDMVQNHLFQLLCLVAMEPPITYSPEELRGKKMDVMHAVRRFGVGEVERFAARGQYGAGCVGGADVVAYRAEAGVARDSRTETYAALRLFLDNWRWEGVPFYLKTGKRLKGTISEISVQFKGVPHCFFPECVGLNEEPTRLLFRIKPEEGIAIRFTAKEPGYHLRLRPAQMHFRYAEAYPTCRIPEAYETLLRDILLGDTTLFMRSDQICEAWEILDPVLAAWGEERPGEFPNYPAGSWGPEEAEELFVLDGRKSMKPE